MKANGYCKKHCGECGYFMQYAGESETTGDCGNTKMNKECGEYHDGELNLQVSEEEDACALFRSTPTKHVLEYIKAHPQRYKQM